MNNTIRPRRLFVGGGAHLSSNAVLLWQELGRLLAEEKGLVVITGGFDRLKKDSSSSSADRAVVDGMLTLLRTNGTPSEKHIETFLPDTEHDWDKLIRFKEGRISVLARRNAQSRRFSMVHSADVAITIEGERGTRSVLDVALAIERPILPLPFGGGASKEVWQAQREDIISWFQISTTEVDRLERTNLSECHKHEVRELASFVHACLMRGFTQGCFVIMRFHKQSDPVFDEAIRPALAAHGFQAWRIDRSVPTGDVIAALRDGIAHCYFAIADTTEDRPNVMYELGLAHATNKPVILLRRESPDGTLPPAPFDFQTQSILRYTDDLSDLRGRLELAISMLSGRIQRASGP